MNYHYQYSNKIALSWVVNHMPNFLFPNLARRQDRIQKNLCGVIAAQEKKPVGLILASFDPSGKNVRVHSLFVQPKHRSQGIGTQLLKRLEDAVSRDGASLIEGYYRSHWDSVPFLQQMISTLNWSPPSEDLILVKGEAKNVIKLFMSDKIKIPEGYQFIPWPEVSAVQREMIKKKKAEEDWYLDYLDPFLMEETIYPVASLAVQHQGQIIGWVISHLISPDTNEFTALFIDKNHRPFKLAHLLARTAITRQKADEVPNFVITSRTDNYVMSRFLIRHAPHTGVFFTKSLRTAKELSH